MKPLLTHATPSLIETMPAVCQPLTRMLTSQRQMEPVSRSSTKGNAQYYEQGDSALEGLAASSPFQSTISLPHNGESNGIV